MFRNLQIRLTVYYSVLIILLVLVLNATVYYSVSASTRQQWVKDTDYKEPFRADDEKFDESSEGDRGSGHGSDLHADGFDYYVELKQDGSFGSFSLPKHITPQMVLAAFDKESGDSSQAKLVKIATSDAHYFLMVKALRVEDDSKGKHLLAINDVSGAYAILDRLFVVLLFISIIGALFAIVIAYVMSARAIRPVQQAYEAKQRFLADASHELRTPLSVMGLSLDILSKEIAAEQDFLIEVVGDMREETNRMGLLVENLLTVARIEGKGIVLHKDDFDLSQMLLTASASMGKLAHNKSIGVVEDIPENLSFFGDRDWLQRVAVILLDNAVKYSKAEAVINISAGTHKGKSKREIYFAVADTGLGMDDETLNNVFERFYRADESRSRKAGGVGLGLSIAETIVRAHGGHIDVVSTLGKGSKFTVYLPVQAEDYSK